MIQFQDVTKKYGKADPILTGVNFSINKGDFAYLIGPTGSGKTTIFRLIIHDLIPSSGTITLAEWNLTKMSKSKIPHLRRRVGVVFQDLKLLQDRTVIENVMLPLDFANMGERDAKNHATEILNEVGLSDKKEMFPAQLSGGERQRVAIARALVFSPDVILADEPTGNLDSKTSFQILDLLKAINKRGTTVFMATHNDKLIDKDDHVIVLEGGLVVEDRNGHAAKSEEKEEKEEKVEKEEKKEAATEEKGSREKIELAKLANK